MPEEVRGLVEESRRREKKVKQRSDNNVTFLFPPVSTGIVSTENHYKHSNWFSGHESHQTRIKKILTDLIFITGVMSRKPALHS